MELSVEAMLHSDVVVTKCFDTFQGARAKDTDDSVYHENRIKLGYTSKAALHFVQGLGCCKPDARQILSSIAGHEGVFLEYVETRGMAAIASRLARLGVPCDDKRKLTDHVPCSNTDCNIRISKTFRPPQNIQPTSANGRRCIVCATAKISKPSPIHHKRGVREKHDRSKSDQSKMIRSQLYAPDDDDDGVESDDIPNDRISRTFSKEDRQRMDRRRRGQARQTYIPRIGDIWRNSANTWLKVMDTPKDLSFEYTLQNKMGDEVRVHAKLFGGSNGKGAAAKQWQLIRMASSISQNADDSDGSTATIDDNSDDDNDRARLNKDARTNGTPAVRINNVGTIRNSRTDTDKAKACVGANATNSASESSCESDGDSGSAGDSDSSSAGDSDSSSDDDIDGDTETGSSSDSDSDSSSDSDTQTLQPKSTVPSTVDLKGYRERGVGVARRTGGAGGGKMRGSKGRFKRKRGK